MSRLTPEQRSELRSWGMYPLEAYELLLDALDWTLAQQQLRERGSVKHLTPRMFVVGFVAFVARTMGITGVGVLRALHLESARDLGRATFELIEKNILAAHPRDRLEDFICPSSLPDRVLILARKELGGIRG